MAVKPVPDGYHSVTPYLIGRDMARVVEFVKRAFGAITKDLMERPDGSIMHAEVVIGDSPVMMGEARGDWAPMPSTLYLYVHDVDAAYRQAVAAGGVPVQEPATQFYGDRHGAVSDPAGNIWWVATHVEDVSPEEMRRRAEAAKPPRA